MTCGKGCRCQKCSSGLKPYYTTDPCLPEACKDKVYVCNYNPVLKTQGEWAIPAVDEIVTVTVPGIVDVVTEAFLWNPDYGALEIVAFDGCDKVKIRKAAFNDVLSGTVVPACTKFILSSPFLPGSDDLLVEDTDSVDLTLAGSDPQTLSANLRVSSVEDNGVEVLEDGVFVKRLEGCCLIEVTTLELNTAVLNNELFVGCVYIITDHEQGRVNAERIYLTALTRNKLTTRCEVITEYDTEAWRGVYDLESNRLIELEDNQGNVCRQFPPPSPPIIAVTPIDDFDWGNPHITNCLVDNSTWNLDYGVAVNIFAVRLTDSAILDITGWTGASIYRLTVQSGTVDLSGSNMPISSVEVISSTIEIHSTHSFNNGLNSLLCIRGGIFLRENVNSGLNMHDVSIINGTLEHRISGYLSMGSVMITGGGQVRLGGTGVSPVGSVTFVALARGIVTGVEAISSTLASIDIRGVSTAQIAVEGFNVSSAASLRISTITSNIVGRNISVESFGLLNITTAGNFTDIKVSQGELANAGFALSGVYLMGKGTKTATGANTDTGRDYFNDSIV